MHGDKEGRPVLLSQFHPTIERHKMVTAARHGDAIPACGEKLLTQFSGGSFRNIFLIGATVTDRTGVFPSMPRVQHHHRECWPRLPDNGRRVKGLPGPMRRGPSGLCLRGQKAASYQTRTRHQKAAPVRGGDGR